ncbi:uncharacterized protein THITE_2171307 [Thermothielavioides terrestris NRRL 8126]|uniref:Uncharacterized protein n=1 Tax=Thermothielavioides terrestris (strain ATCC 38088 / NRRL 8126) TaxID=578455 RepID=G2RF80_THETT|nr:uncharacterized protein THITE_2171307 [Thermothielavioides terrestris NRRL 8126]AEO70363.1 hypothetical protein THITE_2171307 [Thermothielavioides terrestris NRRL 8126]
MTEFRDPKSNQNTRWRRKRQAENKLAVSSLTATARIEDATPMEVGGVSSYPRRRRRKRGRCPAEVKETDPNNDRIWNSWTGRHCAESFPSRNALFQLRHLKAQCPRKHPWSEG